MMREKFLAGMFISVSGYGPHADEPDDFEYGQRPVFRYVNRTSCLWFGDVTVTRQKAWDVSIPNSRRNSNPEDGEYVAVGQDGFGCILG